MERFNAAAQTGRMNMTHHSPSLTCCSVDGYFGNATLLITQARIIRLLKMALYTGPVVKTQKDKRSDSSKRITPGSQSLMGL